MPGILGMISSSGKIQHSLEMDRMVNMLLRSPLLRADYHTNEMGGLASVYLDGAGSPLAVHEMPGGTGRIWLALHGLVFLDDEPSSPAQSMAERLLLRYLNGGVKAVCSLNGTYSLCVFEEKQGRVTLVRDRTGYSKLFYWHSNQRLMFASEYKAISWHPEFRREINPVCVADIFLYRTPLEGRTLFSEIHSLPPAAILTFEKGNLRVETYWKPAYSPPETPEKRDAEYADEMNARMRQSIQRRARPGTCVLLTGGLDSRIAAGTYQQIAPETGLTAATLGLASGHDVRVGRALAHALKISHKHIHIDTTYLQQYAAISTWKTEGKNGAYASWISGAVPFLREQKIRYVMSGLFGNFISGKHYPRGLLNARTLQDGIRAVESNLNPYLQELKKIMRPQIYNSAARESASTLGMIYCRAETDNLIQRGDEFNFYFRICRHANTEDSLGDVSLPLEPYLDNDVFDYALGSITPRARARALFNPMLVLHHLPAAAGVINGNSGRLLADEVAIGQDSFRSTLETYRQKISRRLLPDHARRHSFASIPHNEAICNGSRDFVNDLFAQESLFADFFHPAAVKDMLNNHLCGKDYQFMLIDAMVTFILWRKQFCEQTSTIYEDMSELEMVP
jgi:hypothetical protein